jgi:sulfoxide reductase catalytic subunit YedY
MTEDDAGVKNMLIKRKRGWELPEAKATPESHYLQRRELVCAMSLGAAAMTLPVAAFAQGKVADPSAGFYPAKRNDKYGVPTPMTAEKLATTYNNFYEFGGDKSIWREAQKLEVRPWTIRVGGMVEKPFEIGIDDLLAKMQLEERVYRHRCVETWSMIVPWSGFPLRSLVEFCRPLGSAKYVVMKTLSKPSVMREQRDLLYPWPYTEGLAMDEATNDLAFIATGLYGKPIHKLNGAPLRLVAPWKYGFKGVKSIVSVDFTDKRPVSFWEKLQASEYGFWANVNPQVPHPRWSQATEKPLGSDERIPTLLYNGYAEFVAGLYTDRKAEKLFM